MLHSSYLFIATCYIQKVYDSGTFLSFLETTDNNAIKWPGTSNYCLMLMWQVTTKSHWYIKSTTKQIEQDKCNKKQFLVENWMKQTFG